MKKRIYIYRQIREKEKEKLEKKAKHGLVGCCFYWTKNGETEWG